MAGVRVAQSRPKRNRRYPAIVAETRKVISARFLAGISSDCQIPPQQHQVIVLGSDLAAPTKNNPEQKNGCSRDYPRASERLKRLNPGKGTPACFDKRSIPDGRL
jgi:hypothetical protein